VAEEVQLLAPQAVVLVPDFARIYPQGSLAAPVVGFVGREELHTVGRAGFEHHFDAYLSGEPEQYLAINDAVRREVRLERLHPGRAGYDLELTLNARLQARCETVLKKAMIRYEARGASAVVADARSGRILALASLPSFDPSRPGAVAPEYWRLRPVQDAFEPGFYTLDEVVVFSANVGIIEVAERVPEDRLWRAFDAFGFGRRPGIGFPAEASGLLPTTQTWSKMSRAGFALGQELTVSPLQMAMAYAVIANGGWLPQPQLVISDADEKPGTTKVTRPRVLDEDLARRLREMLEGVVREGTGDLGRVAGFRTAGKTGTAQRAVDGTFDDEHHISWFAGFLSMPDPQIVVVVAIEDPMKDDFWASTVAAPIFAEIAEASAALLDLAPTEPVDPPQTQLARRNTKVSGGDA